MAQTKAAEPNTAPPAAQEGASAEPAGSAEEEGYVPEDEAAVEEEESAAEEAPASAAPSAASLNANRRVPDPNQSWRIVTELVFGLLGNSIGYGVGGMAVQAAALSSGAYSEIWLPVAMMAGLAGGALTTTLAVWVAGMLWQGKGQLGPTFVGGLIGTGIELGIGLGILLVTLTNPALLGLLGIVGSIGVLAPLLGAVLGYEKSHVKALRSAGPVAVPLQIEDGGGIALAWAI